MNKAKLIYGDLCGGNNALSNLRLWRALPLSWQKGEEKGCYTPFNNLLLRMVGKHSKRINWALLIIFIWNTVDLIFFFTNSSHFPRLLQIHLCHMLCLIPRFWLLKSIGHLICINSLISLDDLLCSR